MNINKFGFEKEFFVKSGKDFIIITSEINLPFDDCHWLAEARGEPHKDPECAAALFEVEAGRLYAKAKALGLTLVDAHTCKLPKELVRTARRDYGKGVQHNYFARGIVYKNDNPRAGLHIHFDVSQKANCYNKNGHACGSTSYNDYAEMPRIIWAMDQAFSSDIKAARRVPGEYELKDYGFEYRSLPSTISIAKVVEALKMIQSMR